MKMENGKKKISNTKTCFFENINKVDKPLARPTKKAQKKIPVTTHTKK